MSDKTVILAIFDDKLAAGRAAAALKNSGSAHKSAVKRLVLNEKGKLEFVADSRDAKDFAEAVGIGVAAALLRSDWRGRLVLAGVASGVRGLQVALRDKELRIDVADSARIARQLADGRAAVVVVSPGSEGSFVVAKLTELGGTLTEYKQVIPRPATNTASP